MVLHVFFVLVLKTRCTFQTREHSTFNLKLAHLEHQVAGVKTSSHYEGDPFLHVRIGHWGRMCGELVPEMVTRRKGSPKPQSRKLHF